MAFPASQARLESTLAQVMGTAFKVKGAAVRLRADTSAGPVARSRFVGLMTDLERSVATWDALASTPGLAAYAKTQFDDPALDIAAEFTAMRAAAVTLRDWIFNNLPKDAGSGAVLLYTLETDGTLSDLTVSTAATAGFRAAADAFIATID
jgi:hypothetical protein